MAKYAPDAMIDASLDYVAGSNYCCVSSGSPITYADAFTNNILAGIVMTSGCFAKADDTSGRKLTMSALTSASITANGTAAAVCLVETAGSTLRYVTTCTEQALVSGGTVDIPSWKMN
jgi:hypothetical protein